MSEFQDKPASASSAPLDPFKHVKYNLGMVLGVDDFDQEFAYLSHRDQWLTRDTIGYGTVCGLKVSIETDSRGPRVVVDPGVALNPRGQLIRVTPAQCAYLNDWLAANHEAVNRQIGSLPFGEVHLYVVLCYRDCPTDDQPVAGEPCRTEAEATVATRWKDDFKLQLSLQPPDQMEEQAVRDLVNWLGRVKISDTATSVSLDDFLAEVRNATYVLRSPPASPPSPPDFMYGSPPAWLAINTADACAYMRAAFRVWVTELRPLWRGPSCDGTSPLEDCVLLAELHVPLDNGVVDSTRAIVVDEEQRPFLIHLRLLQEWLLCGRPSGEAVGATRTFATLSAQDTTTIRAWLHHPALLDVLPGAVTIEIDEGPGGSPPQMIGVTRVAPDINVFDLDLDAPVADGSRVAVRFDAAQIVEAANPARSLLDALAVSDYAYLDRDGNALLAYLVAILATPPGGGVTDHGSLTGLGDDDHLQYLLANGTRALTGPLSASNNRITNLAQAITNGDAVRFEQAIKVNDTAGGDLSGAYPNPTVAGLQGRSIASDAPQDGQVLTWDAAGNRWGPRPPQVQVAPSTIVAAGIVGTGRTRLPVLGNLKVRLAGDGLLEVTFDGYHNPEDPLFPIPFQYVVKALPVFSDLFPGGILVNFLKFDDAMLVLTASAAGGAIPKDQLAELEFMIEVSWIGGAARPFAAAGPMAADTVAGVEPAIPRVNLNTATVEELRTLPRIGPDLANRIVKARGRKGFTDLNDLLNVPGIGEETLRIIQPFVTLGD